MTPTYIYAWWACQEQRDAGPLLLKYDHPHGLRYRKGVVDGLQPSLWG